jgi:hypothetical protein
VFKAFGLNVGHGPQNCRQTAIFSSLSATTFISVTPTLIFSLIEVGGNGVFVTNRNIEYKSCDMKIESLVYGEYLLP